MDCCCLVVEIIMFVLGVIGVARGTVALTRTRVTTGMPARIAGALLLIPLPVYIVAGVVSGVSLITQAKNPDPKLATTAVGVQIAAAIVTLVCFFAALILCAVTAQRIKKKPKIPEEAEEYFEERKPQKRPDDHIQE
jgi:hypothetical protein